VSEKKQDVWVATGVYSEAIALRNDNRLYGGFSGAESAPEERKLSYDSYTLLDGSPADKRVPAEPVVEKIDPSRARLDGFTLTGGNANGSDDGQYGGGLFCKHLDPKTTSTIANCLITSNTATFSGGGIYCYRASPEIRHCAIIGNRASDSGGGIAC